jgi:mediator of RNA polymerase II transcription subunit 13, fungi type
MRYLGLESVADAVYDRVLVVTRRITSRTLSLDTRGMQALFQEPAYTLARPTQRKATFRLEAHPSSLDVVDRMTILHIGYRLSPCGKWLLAASVDQRGEMHETKIWVVPTDGKENFIVKSVWALAKNIAARANLEWRIAIAKLGPMDELEIDGKEYCIACLACSDYAP